MVDGDGSESSHPSDADIPDGDGLPAAVSSESDGLAEDVTGDPEDGRRKRSTVWAVIVIVILLLLLLWFLCEYLGARSAKLTGIKPGVSGAVIVVPPGESTIPSSTPAPSTVPDVVGMERSAAIGVLAGAGYAAQVTEVFGTSHPENTVFRQSPLAGSVLEQGGTVGIMVQIRSLAAPRVRVPDVIGLTQSAAESKLKALGFNIVLSYAPVYEKPGRINSQWPLGGDSQVQGGDVQIQVTVKP